MMATEATVGGPVDVSVNEPSLNQPTATDSDFQNDDPLNIATSRTVDDIENKQIADIVDELVNSAEASVSGGSDTEAFKTDPTKLFGETGHTRSSSTVKKPQSFKSVSVNRTFLASKGAINSTSRPESTAGSASTIPQPTVSSSASRLKLVAKSGSTLGGASKTLNVNGKPPGAPDPNLVWNRNRPPTQPESKKRSDEELKHDGIHLADRLGPEDLKGQSNWADIDDDDEWAPDTITWTDGTKITLPAAEEAVPSPVIQPATVDKVKKDPIPIPIPKPKSPAPISSASGSPSIKHGVLASGKGLVFKGAPEKPTLVAKPPAPPGPVKSPWAPLPPVEKVHPLVMELPTQVPPSRYPLRDASNAKSATPPPPTKEIAADDFSRNYRDGPFNPSRELFNSQSGRYEPVSDRRGSRHDIHARQPALLQRQAHNDQQGPAEPSAAFQTSRNSAPEGPYSRRRGSSNVSGGSGHLAHRIGGKPHDMPPPPELGLNQGQALLQHVGSIPGSAESPVSSQTFSSANNQSSQRAHPPTPYQTLVSPHQAHAVPYQNAYNQEPPQVDPDWETAQKEYMKQKREEAVRRRLEEELREETAKQARIAEKLKALGPAPERKSAKKDTLSVVQRTDIPATLAIRSKGTSEIKTTPDSAPIVATYSEAKVEKPVTTDTASNERPEPDLRVTNGSIKPDQPRMPPAQSIASAQGQSAVPWSESSQHPDRFQTWNSNHQNVRENVWGAPGNDRSLGNGTFNADIGPLSESHVATGPNMMHRPAPIAPPRSTPQATQPEAPSNRLPPIGPPRVQPNPANAWKTYDIKADDERRRLERIKQRETPNEKASGPSFTDTWRSVDLNGEGKRSSVGTYVQSHREPSTELHEAEKAASHPEVVRPVVLPPPTTAPPTGPSAQTRTGSRFFPSSKDVTPSMQPSSRSKSPTPPPPTADGHPVYDGDATKPHVALPPLRPRVRLPPSAQPAAPGPIAPPSKQSPVSFTAAATCNILSKAPDTNIPARPVSRGRGFNGIPQKPHEIASQENWQSKINNLMGKKSASPAKFMPVGSSMIDSLESSRSHDFMDVPMLSPSGTDSSEDSSFTSKEMAEECFGEQEMGSLPAVRIPTETPDALWQAVKPNWFPAPTELRINPAGCEPFKFSFDYAHGKSVIPIPGVRVPVPEVLDILPELVVGAAEIHRTTLAIIVRLRLQAEPCLVVGHAASDRVERLGADRHLQHLQHSLDTDFKLTNLLGDKLLQLQLQILPLQWKFVQHNVYNFPIFLGMLRTQVISFLPAEIRKYSD
ncbi:hypothetical protein E0Z10_g4686 [Xylaria hypoxylon]|uniref:Uncharacterized protein n=1 Tax=Xylaria hypoxylon TaxID=37992 RepID=A0A4Z0YXU8_9PEZI|nr:hypothetical protein E0Z10_g4686 [Xylaria hypoxylon]